LGYKTSNEEDKNITSKISNFLHILGILSNVWKPNLVQRQSRLKVYKISAHCDVRRLKTEEVKFNTVYKTTEQMKLFYNLK
jgi:hypothetical protein